MKISIIWDIMPYSPLKFGHHFGGTCLPHHQGGTISHARNQYEAVASRALIMLVSCLAYSLTQNMEETLSSKMLFDY
jgi:hypothetical protein